NAYTNQPAMVCQARIRSFSPITSLRSTVRLARAILGIGFKRAKSPNWMASHARRSNEAPFSGYDLFHCCQTHRFAPISRDTTKTWRSNRLVRRDVFRLVAITGVEVESIRSNSKNSRHRSPRTLSPLRPLHLLRRRDLHHAMFI